MSVEILSRLIGTLKSTFRINKATIDTSALTVARTVTLPDASLTVAGINVAQRITGQQTFIGDAFKLENRGADEVYTLTIESGSGDPGADRRLTFLMGGADRSVTLNGDVTLPQTLGASGPTLGQVIALARQCVRY